MINSITEIGPYSRSNEEEEDNEAKLDGSSGRDPRPKDDMTGWVKARLRWIRKYYTSRHPELLEEGNDMQNEKIVQIFSSIEDNGSWDVMRKDERTNDKSLVSPSAEDKTIKEIEPPLFDQLDIDRRWATIRNSEQDKAMLMDNCTTICCEIKNKYSQNILEVWPAYDSANKNNVQFVVVTKEDSERSDFDIPYSTVVRRVNTFSKEANLVMEFERNREIKLSFEDSEKIKMTINSKAEELLDNHRYLSAISGSGIRSRGFSTGEHELFQEACIVLYVQKKGIIPIDETEFPKELDGIPVDVMEGEFQTTGNNLFLGCEIQSEKRNISGTLGGFVEHPKYGLSAVTCAHVVLGDTEIPHLQREGKTTWNSGTKPVYQPDRTDPGSNYFGQVKEVIFNSGGNGKPGVDLAVIQVEKRPPLTGHFQNGNVNFETGKVRFTLNENNNSVVKCGRKTEETNGFVKFTNAAVRLINRPYQLPSVDSRYQLVNQYDIGALGGPFADEGDSGSLVLKRDVSGDFVCIGMVVGHTLPTGNGIVTPISAILSELGVQGFKDFRLDKQSAIENRLSTIEGNVDLIISKLP